MSPINPVSDGDLATPANMNAWLHAAGLGAFGVVTPEEFGAIGDGVADDTIPLQTALEAGAGKAVYLTGVYLVSQPLVYYQRTHIYGRSQDTIVKQADGSNLDYIFVASQFISNSSGGGGPVRFSNFFIDGNRDNNGASQTHGILCFNFFSMFDRMSFLRFGGDGLRFEGGSAFKASANNLVENWISNCRFRFLASAVRAVDPTGNSITDSWLRDCTISQTEFDGVRIDSGAGWVVAGNHLYSVGGTAIRVDRAWQTDISNNQIENYGSNDDGGEYAGIRCESIAPSRGLNVIGNRVHNNRTVAGNSYWGIRVRVGASATNVPLVISGNSIKGNGVNEIGLQTRRDGSSTAHQVITGNLAINFGAGAAADIGTFDSTVDVGNSWT